ncbi:MAG: ribokinase, partial [Chitinophagaceae bacterium]|nr:ribokinase [Rubrivivax sp.]
MSPTIVLVGSIHMDLMLRCPHLPKPGETVLGHHFRTEPGGKGGNQAVAAARLGGRVALVACMGDDAFGTAALTRLRAEGVDLRHALTLPGTATGVAMVQVDDAGQNCVALAPGANAGLTPAQVEAAAAAIQQAGLLVCQLETPLPAVARAIALAHAAGVPVLLNPAPAVPLSDSLLSQVDLLVLNEGEAAVVSGLPVDGA